MSRRSMLILGFSAWLVVLPLVHAALPWGLSHLTQRWGWVDGRPGLWNLPGLFAVAAGSLCLAWIFLIGLMRLDRIPEKVEWMVSPYLLTEGPYALTRNPMYVSALLLWSGWALFYGSWAVLIGFLALGALSFIVVPREERGLEKRFGETYLRYKKAVPRWVGKRHHVR